MFEKNPAFPDERAFTHKILLWSNYVSINKQTTRTFQQTYSSPGKKNILRLVFFRFVMIYEFVHAYSLKILHQF